MRLPKKLAALAKTIRARNDCVFVKRFEYEHPTLAVVGVKLEKGVVVAAGPGKLRRRRQCFKHGIDGKRDLWFEDGSPLADGGRHPMPVRVGDCVEFSPRGQTTVYVDNEELVVVRAGAIYGRTNDSKAEAMLWQQSAGHDRHGNFLSGAENWQR